MRNLMKVNPIFSGNDLFNVMDDFFSKGFGDIYNSNLMKSQPQVNVRETEGNFQLDVAAPGLKKDDFKIRIEDDHLIISAEVKNESEEKDDNYRRREFNYSSFERRYHLPETINVEAVSAKYEDGVLHIVIPKAEAPQAETKVIEIS